MLKTAGVVRVLNTSIIDDSIIINDAGNIADDADRETALSEAVEKYSTGRIMQSEILYICHHHHYRNVQL